MKRSKRVRKGPSSFIEMLERRLLLAGDPPPSVAAGSGVWIWANPFGDVSVSESIASDPEFDVFAFMPDVNGSYTISTSGPLDTQLRIYNSTGAAVTGIIDEFFGGESVNVNASSGSWIYIAVGGYEADTGNYTLAVNGPNYSAPNVTINPPNNTAGANGTIDYGGDIDYIAITAPPDTSTLSLTLTPAAPLDSFLLLYNSAGTRVAFDDTGNAGQADSIVNFSTTAGATYYVGLMGALRTTTGNYHLDVNFDPDIVYLNPPANITPPPDDGSQLRLNQLGDASINGTISSADEYDVYTFIAPFASAFTIATLGSLDSQLRIYDSSGTAITSLIDSTIGGESTNRNLTGGSFYYIAVAAFGAQTGDYTLTINGPTLGVLIPGYSPPLFQHSVTSQIGAAGAVSPFRLNAPAQATQLHLEVRPIAGINTYLQLFDDAGQLLQSSNSAAGESEFLFKFPVTAGATYYAIVTGFLGSDTGTFRLLSDFDPDDDPGAPPDVINTQSARWAPPGPLGESSIGGTIATADEYHVISFFPTQAASYTITTLGSSLDSQLRIYDANGISITPLSDNAFSETIKHQLNAGTWYYIGIGGSGSNTGIYSLRISGPTQTPPPLATDPPAYFANVSGTIANTAQANFYRLVAPDSVTELKLTLDPAPPLHVGLFDSVGHGMIGIGSRNGSALTLNYSVTAGSVYYVVARGETPGDTGAYQLTVDFNPNAWAEIRGRAFVDRNSNGIVDAGEPGIPGWTLYLDLDDDGQHDPAEPLRVTDAGGNYLFDNLTSNLYHVAQLTQQSWIQTSPAQGGTFPAFSPPPDENPPLQAQTSGKLQDQFVLDGQKWPQSALGAKVTLTYSYSNLLDGGLSGLTSTELRAAIEEALRLWARYAPLTFVEVPDVGPPPSDTSYFQAGAPDLRFGHHFIDGVSNTLAHAFSPPPNGGNLAGDVHFDSGDSWGLNTAGSVTDIIEVAVHEIGHALGLDHENSATAIMNPFHGNRYNGLGTAFLYPDDIAGIRAIYGARIPRLGTWLVNLDQGEFATNINFGNFPTYFFGTDSNDRFKIRLDSADPSRLQVVHNPAETGEIIYSIAKSRVPNLSYDALGGDDQIYIESTNGNPNPTDGLNFDAGLGVDVLLVIGGQLSLDYDLASVGVEFVQTALGADITLAASQHLLGMSIAAGPVTLNAPLLHVRSLAIGLGGTLDIGNNAMILAPGTISTVNSYIKDASLRGSAISNRRLGAIQNTNPIRTSFAGDIGLSGNETLVLNTLIGDLNLDKTVSISDFIDLASHFNQSGTWREGDLNYDGMITIADFIDLASNFNQSFAGSATPQAPAPAAALTLEGNSSEPVQRLASPDPIAKHVKSQQKKRHRHHHRPAHRIPPRPRLFRFQI